MGDTQVHRSAPGSGCGVFNLEGIHPAQHAVLRLFSRPTCFACQDTKELSKALHGDHQIGGECLIQQFTAG